MRSNYKPLGEFIREVNKRDIHIAVDMLLGVSIQKKFIPSIANIVGTDMSTYKIIKRNQFAYGPVTSRNWDKISIALLDTFDEAIVSQSYTVFEVVNTTLLLPEYLMMWFRRPEFDRYARFKSHGSARETFDWEEMCKVELPIPSIEIQKEIVTEYNVLINRINLNNTLIEKLEDTAQTLYKQWFVDISDDLSDKDILNAYIELNPILTLKRWTQATYIEMSDVSTNKMSIGNSTIKRYDWGSRFQNWDTLLARITPCLENWKTAYVSILNKNEVAFWSTEFIVMRARKNISSYWVYCLAKDEDFRTYAISSMVWSSWRQRVHEDYIKIYKLNKIEQVIMDKFDRLVSPIFELIWNKSIENQRLYNMNWILLSRLATI